MLFEDTSDHRIGFMLAVASLMEGIPSTSSAKIDFSFK